jgi:hypothetical protein
MSLPGTHLSTGTSDTHTTEYLSKSIEGKVQEKKEAVISGSGTQNAHVDYLASFSALS